MTTTYQYPADGQYNETVATIDGRRYTINTQYGVIDPHGDHSASCAQINRIGGVCDCGLLAGIDVQAMIAHARAHGLFGRPEAPDAPDTDTTDTLRPLPDLCPHCGTLCYGDCQAH